MIQIPHKQPRRPSIRKILSSGMGLGCAGLAGMALMVLVRARERGGLSGARSAGRRVGLAGGSEQVEGSSVLARRGRARLALYLASWGETWRMSAA